MMSAQPVDTRTGKPNNPRIEETADCLEGIPVWFAFLN